MTSQTVPFQPDDYFRLRFLQEADLSPDGSEIVYAVSWVEEEAPKPGQDESKPQLKEIKAIFLRSLPDGASRQLTSGTRQDHSPAWSPDGKQIAFLSDRTGATQVFILPREGGEARQVTELANGVGGPPVWSPDGRRIAFTASAQDEHRPDAPYRVTRKIWRFDAINRTDRFNQDLWIVAVEESGRGREPRRLTADGWHYGQPSWSADGTELLVTAMLGPDSYEIGGQARIVDLDGDVRSLTGDWGSVAAAEWLPGGDILFVGVPEGSIIGTQQKLWRLPQAGDEPICLTPDLPYQVGGGLQADMPVASRRVVRILVDEAGTHAFVKVQAGGEVSVYRVPTSPGDPPTRVIGGPRACDPMALRRDALLFSAHDINHTPDLFLANLADGAERQLTQLNQDLFAQRARPEVVHLTFPGEDGVQVEGWLLTPPTGNAPYPGFLYIHGGPHGAFGHAFHWDSQMLAGAGYAVLIINHRASTGYGDEFATAIQGDWGHLDYTDLMAGLDHAIEQGLLDPDRLALGGLSGGGNLTCWIVGHTDRFKAAIPENPVTNWVSFYGVSDIGPWFAVKELGGHPHEIPEVYRRCSPITYAHRCTTPTLLVQGEADWRCPAEQSEQFYTTLRANGCPVEMLRLPGSPHGGAIVGRPEVRRAQNQALLDWVQRYVKSR